MSSRFPVLHNRPIDQWRVTELKEELRRRGYPIKGLKEELVRRLDEAIRKEKEAEDAIDEEQVNQLNAISNPQDDCEKEGAVNPLAEDDTVTAVERNRNIVVDETTVETDKSTMDEDEDSKPQDGGGMFVADLVGAVENKSVVSVSGKSSSPRIDSCKQDSRSNEKSGYAEPLVEDVKLDERSGNSEPPVEDVKLNEQSEYSEPLGEKDKFIEDSKHSESPVEDLKLTEKNENPDPSVDVVECNLLEPNDEVSEVSFLEPPVEDVKPNLSEPNDQVSEVNLSEAPDDVKLNLSEPNDQVSEVSHALEFQVKCESISTDYVSINEKNELKDNFTANNFPLELEVVKPEMVQPSSSTCSPIGVDVHPFDGDKGPGDNQASLEEMDVKYTAEVNFSKKLDTMDGGSPEKLNLDRISGDESMDEDVLENKQMESQSALQVGEKSEASKVNDAEEQGVVDVVEGGFSADKNNIDEEMQPTAFTGKRALEAVEIKEPVKRQRRWNSETIKVPESQTSNIASPNTSKDTSQPTPRRIFARSDSTISGGSPKERTVPPAQKPATTSLRIDRFLRPFTLKAVRELLGKTGSVSDFWMDHIKTHCYATYSSVEEAIATRNAVYNLQWPPNGGRLLVAEFVDPQEVKARLEAPPQPAVITSPPSTAPAAPSLQQPQHPPSTPVQRGSRHQPPPPPPPTLPPPPPLPNPPPVREQLPPPPPLPKKPDPPVVTLDDLFKKTKATPRIYFLPLSEEQVAAKLGAQRKNVKE